MTEGDDAARAPGREPRDHDEERPAGPATGEVHIDAIEAAVAAGLVPQDPPPPREPVDEPTAGYALPDWAEPPTGQVPRVLLDDPDAEAAEPTPRGPTWRQERENWNEDLDLSFLAEEDTSAIAGSVEPVVAPFGFVGLDPEPGEVPPVELEPVDDDAAAWGDLFAPQRQRPHRRHAPRHDEDAARRRGGPAIKTPPKNAVIATATGVALGVVAVLCLLGGPAPTDALVALMATLAAGEAFGALQRATYHPATLVGLLAVPAFVIGAYLFGPGALAVVAASAFAATGAWYLRRRASDEPVVDAAVTILVVIWVGLLAGFAGLLLAPSLHPHNHGIALVFGVIACTVGHDVGSYAVGARLGRHKLAPSISPGKTIEGLVGGTIGDLVVALVVVSRFHPLGIRTAAVLGIVVAVVAPLGDLIESRFKRDLGIKDMGSLLPGHGGVLDRIDAMLFVLPAAYVVFRLAQVA